MRLLTRKIVPEMTYNVSNRPYYTIPRHYSCFSHKNRGECLSESPSKVLEYRWNWEWKIRDYLAIYMEWCVDTNRNSCIIYRTLSL